MRIFLPLSSRTKTVLLVLAPCASAQVAGLHRASPSATLDKSSIVKLLVYYSTKEHSAISHNYDSIEVIMWKSVDVNY
jgi:hypothetical protein